MGIRYLSLDILWSHPAGREDLIVCVLVSETSFVNPDSRSQFNLFVKSFFVKC